MRLTHLLYVLALALAPAGCGGSRAHPAADRGVTAAGPEAVLAAFADAIRRDDGAALAAVVDPDHGLTLWYTPGAGYAAFETIAASDVRPPSQHVRAGVEDSAAAWAEYDWKGVVRHLDDGLAKLDHDPADPMAPIYGDCGDMDAPVRAYLRGGQSDRDLRAGDLGGDGEVADDEVVANLTELNMWGLRVYLRSTAGGWRVVHVVAYEPCSV